MNYGYRPPAGAPRRRSARARRARPIVHPALRRRRARRRRSRGARCSRWAAAAGGGAAYVARALDPRRDGRGRSVAARHRALPRAASPRPRLTFQVGDAERLPFGDGTFDVVLNVESSHCYGRFDLFLGEVRRVLRPERPFPLRRLPPARARSPAWRAVAARRGLRDRRRARSAPRRGRGARRRRRPQARLHRPRSSTGRSSGIFREFAALRGSELNDALRSGDLGYRAFVLKKALRP